MICKTYELGSLKNYKFVVVLSRYDGRVLLSRHRERSTWETQGGHIEQGEAPMDAAKRELYEESGAEEFSLSPLGDYWMVFTAVIYKLGKLPQSEMAETKTFDALPENLTYPAITPVLFHYEKKMKKSIETE